METTTIHPFSEAAQAAIAHLNLVPIAPDSIFFASADPANGLCDPTQADEPAGLRIVEFTHFKASGKYYTSGWAFVPADLALYRSFEETWRLARLGNRFGLIVAKFTAEDYVTVVEVPYHEHAHPHLVPTVEYTGPEDLGS